MSKHICLFVVVDVEMEVSLTFCQTGLELQSSTSQEAGITDIGHNAQPEKF
jgi:hypothetical protein